MEEKMLPVPNEGHRRRQKQRRRRFPWGSIATVILVVAVCVYAFTLFGDKESPENSQVNDTTTQGPDDVQVGLLDESSPQNTQTANDDTDWNLVLVNYENAIPENYEPKLVEVPGGEKVDERIYDLYFWLQENSYKYGFIFRYPGDKTDITGVAEEVWHYRYVGVEAATEMYEKGLCLEEYLAERQAEQ